MIVIVGNCWKTTYKPLKINFNMSDISLKEQARELMLLFDEKEGELSLSEKDYKNLYRGLFVLTINVSEGFPFQTAAEGIGLKGVNSEQEMLDALLTKINKTNSPVTLNYHQVYMHVKLYWAFVYYPHHITLEDYQWRELEGYLEVLKKKE